MTANFSYIGDILDPDFYWHEPSQSPDVQNLPRRLVPRDPYRNIGISVFWMMDQVTPGRSNCRQLD